MTYGPKPTPAIERFLAKIHVTLDGCWIWIASTRYGYGTFHPTHDTTCVAHRWSYEFFKRPVPPGLDLDHLCRARACVNPDHLEPVTRAENLHRSPLITHGTDGKFQRWEEGEQEKRG